MVREEEVTHTPRSNIEKPWFINEWCRCVWSLDLSMILQQHQFQTITLFSNKLSQEGVLEVPLKNSKHFLLVLFYSKWIWLVLCLGIHSDRIFVRRRLLLKARISIEKLVATIIDKYCLLSESDPVVGTINVDIDQLFWACMFFLWAHRG